MRHTIALPAVLFLASTVFAQPHWSGEFANGEYTFPGNGFALAVFDDGRGPSLYMAEVPSTGSIASIGISRWTGNHWARIGGGPWTNGAVYSMAVYDDGSGPALYAGGYTVSPTFEGRIARWNGLAWSDVVTLYPGLIRGIAALDDGSGPELYTFGQFSSIGGQWVMGAARWNGIRWQGIGTAFAAGGQAFSAASFDDGTGPAIYFGGVFNSAGGVPAANIARWNGSVWSAVGAGFPGGGVNVLATLDDGAGPALYAGGSFTSAGGQPAEGVARWDGYSWTAVGSGLGGSASVNSLALYGPSHTLYAGGLFLGHVARLVGGTWSVLDGGTLGAVSALAPFDDGRGPALFIAGEFSRAGSYYSPRVARWDGTHLGPPLLMGPDLPVGSFQTVDSGQGEQMHIRGSFDHIGQLAVPGAAIRAADQWSPAPMPNLTGASEYRFSPPPNPTLFAAGSRMYPSGQQTSLAAWDSSRWSPLIDDPAVTLDTLAFAPDSSLYLGATANFSSHFVARWTDSGYAPLPGFTFTSPVSAMTWFDDRVGPRLYACGASALKRWADPQAQLVSWFSQANTPAAQALAVFDDGHGPALYVGGNFREVGTILGSTQAYNIARWSGTGWTALGAGLNDLGGAVTITSMIPFDDGTGPGLVVAGTFTRAGGLPASNIARWDGSAWSTFGGGIDGPVQALAAFDDGRGPSLWVGGNFHHAGGQSSGYLARWIVPHPCYANCDQSTTPPILNILDFTCFLNKFAAGDPTANCDGSTTPPVLNILDFTCFLNAFAAGCP